MADQDREVLTASISPRNNAPLFVIAVGFSVRRTRRRAMEQLFCNNADVFVAVI